MFKYFKIILPILFLFFFIKPVFAEQQQINLYLFYGKECPHCENEIKFLNKLQEENKNIAIKKYEVWHNQENAQLLQKVVNAMGVDSSGVPVLIIGDKSIIGYYNDSTTGEKIKEAIDYYKNNKCEDVIAPLVSGGSADGSSHDSDCAPDCACKQNKEKVPETVNVPFFGKIEIKNISLPALTILIGALDGFNPCAMWVLLFLISLLLGMNNRKKMWILGLAFIVSSGAVYFLFMAAWLNFFLFVGFIIWIRILIAIIALISGTVNLRHYWLERKKGCVAEGGEKRRKVFEKIRKVIETEKFLLAVFGIILLAAAINLVELVCSAGLPAVYTQILSMSNLPRWEYYAYLVFYIFIFMLDDIIVFVLAMITLQMKAISSKYARWSNLIGGIVMVAIGLLLIFKPGWLMF